jgi:hypothetical protein
MRPPDDGQIEALALALDGAQDGHAYMATEGNECIACGITGSYGHASVYRARLILEALPYGWELVKYTWTGDNDAKAP